jgi:hypothetical protein
MLTRQAYEYIKLGTGGTYSLSRDANKHNLWDTRFFGVAATNVTFFSQPLGAPWIAGNKTINETNLTDSGKLPNGQTFLINAISIGLQAYTTTANTTGHESSRAFINLIHSSVFEIKVAGRDFDFQVHGSQFLSRPISISGQLATNNPVRVGDMIASGIIKLDPAPIFLDQLVSFQVTQTIVNANPAVTAILNADSSVLYGLYATMNVVLIGFLTRAK